MVSGEDVEGRDGRDTESLMVQGKAIKEREGRDMKYCFSHLRFCTGGGEWMISGGDVEGREGRDRESCGPRKESKRKNGREESGR